MSFLTPGQILFDAFEWGIEPVEFWERWEDLSQDDRDSYERLARAVLENATKSRTYAQLVDAQRKKVTENYCNGV